ncbi:sensor histidine kinase [Robinsoniella peoriensis]|uniref:sensor histidine kinase n=1 Tax=Robinsoniella peoriensis TaxID=180332 RepID=UPI00085C5ADF|nr:GHKL domain-containing protein [Robinsoniella peoriensis]
MTVFTGKCVAALLETVIFYIFAIRCVDTGNMDLRKKRMILLLLAVVDGLLMLPVKNGGSAFLVYVAEIILWMAVIYKISVKPVNDFVKFYAFIEFFGIIGAAFSLITNNIFGFGGAAALYSGENILLVTAVNGAKNILAAAIICVVIKFCVFEKIPLWIWKVSAIVSVFVNLAATVFMMNENANRLLEPWVLMYVVAMLCVFGGLLTWYSRENLKRENQYLLMQQKLLREHYKVLEEQNELVQKMRHDIGNHLQTIERLVRDNHTESMGEITKRLNKEYDKLLQSNISRNVMIDAVLHNKITECAKNKIKLQLNMAHFVSGRVDDVDWLSIFYNLFDNAIESCMRMENSQERFINVKSQYRAGYQVLIFCNARSGETRALEAKREGNFKTSKKDKFCHGLGLDIVKGIVKKYEGSMECKEEEKVFRTLVSLRVGTAEKN